MDPYLPPPIQLPQRSGKLVLFRFYVKGTRNYANLVTATSIRLESSLKTVGQAPIEAIRTHPQADWANGLVPILIDDTNLTLTRGTYDCYVVAEVGTERLVCPEASPFMVEVTGRPSYVP